MYKYMEISVCGNSLL